MAAELDFEPRPEGYIPPDWKAVSSIASVLREQRQRAFNYVWGIKRARRHQWDDVIAKIPKAYRKITPELDMPEISDMLQRITGMIGGQTIQVDVDPPSSRQDDVRKAAKEREALAAVVMDVQDQQDRDTFLMGVDAQVAYGESWIGVWPDPRPFAKADYSRGKEEDPKSYSKRYADMSVDYGIPLCFQDYDPQTVLPFFADHNRLAITIIESEHALLDIEMGLGYEPITNTEGKRVEWRRKTLSQPYVSADTSPGGAGTVDVPHARPVDQTNPERPTPGAVKKTIYVDCWTYQCYLDGVLVEQWDHNFGCVPIFRGGGLPSSDRESGWEFSSVIDAPLSIARQLVYFAAIMASHAAQHGWPTPFLKNPETGLVDAQGRPLTRQIALGEMNLLAGQEELTFPYLDAKMLPDFFKQLDFLTARLDNSSLSNFSKAIGTDMAGYAVAQVRAMNQSLLKPLYTSTARQWRKILYFIRHLVKTRYTGGVYLRGAVDVTEVDGQEVQYRPVLEYGPQQITSFAVNVTLDEGIVQDKLAERKSAIETHQAGIWSLRRAMEHAEVDDPAAEAEEIAVDRLLNSPAADQQVLTMAMAIAARRYQLSRTDMSSPFMVQLAQAQKELMGQQPGTDITTQQFQNQGPQPQNALPGGQPMQQSPAPAAPQQGGPMAGADAGQGTDLESLGAPGIPGGVTGGNPPIPAGVS